MHLPTIKDIRQFFQLLKAGKTHEVEQMLEAGRVTGIFQIRRFKDDKALFLDTPYDISEPFRNQLVNLGMAEMWKLICSNGGTAFSAANAYLGVGDSTSAFAVAQTDLQAVSNKVRVGMDSTYPTAPTNGAQVFRSTFGSGVGNFHWEEFALFNASSSGVMLNRSLSDQGTKTAGQSWQLTYTITLS